MTDPNQHDILFKAEVLAKLEICGVESGRVNVTYEDELQDYNIAISGPAERLSDEQYLSLARLASANAYTISFDDEEARTCLWRATQKAELERARSWLQDRGMLSGLPLFEPAREDLATYVRSLEAYCGIAPGSALEVKDETRLEMSGVWQSAVLNDDQGWTLINAITASNLQEQGIIAGIIGGT